MVERLPLTFWESDMIFMCMHSRRAQLVKRKAGTFSEFASLASEAKGLAISINQAAPSFFHLRSFRSQRHKKKRKQIHTKRSYIQVGKNHGIRWTKTTVIYSYG